MTNKDLYFSNNVTYRQCNLNNMQRPQMIYIVGSAGSGKTTTVKWIMNKLDISLFKVLCLCLSNPTKNKYFIGRYRAFHGI